MRQATDFSRYITIFFSRHLPDRRGASANTVQSYWDCFILFFQYMENEHGIKPEKMFLETVRRPHVEGFLDWLEDGRGCTVTTRNVWYYVKKKYKLNVDFLPNQWNPISPFSAIMSSRSSNSVNISSRNS